jgi:hypothetical protein
MAIAERIRTTVTSQRGIVTQISVSLIEADWVPSDIPVKVVAFNFLNNTLAYSMAGSNASTCYPY